MSFCRTRLSLSFLHIIIIATAAYFLQGGAFAQSSPSSAGSGTHASQRARSTEASLDAGSVKAGVYRSVGFGFTCKVPAGWVLRTEEMNASDQDDAKVAGNAGKGSRVLLAAFSRPPEARAEDVNSSILIAAESVAAYPGLTDAAQYFGPVMEVAKAQGLEMDEEPYGFVLGTKSLVRGDFQKDVGKRVMRQSTLVVLVRGYVVSFTFIGGTEDEVEELVDGLSFGVGVNSTK
jgi:hypothetical protein